MKNKLTKNKQKSEFLDLSCIDSLYSLRKILGNFILRIKTLLCLHKKAT